MNGNELIIPDQITDLFEINAPALDQTTIEAILDSSEEYPIDFDEAWKWIGYSTKQKAHEKLTAHFAQGADYVFTQMVKNPKGGRSSHKYALSVDCFKAFCMMAGTKKGQEVRFYFIDIEKEYRKLKKLPTLPSRLELARELHLTSGNLVEALEKLDAAEKQIEADRPKREFFNAVAQAEQDLSMVVCAKILARELGLKIGRNRFVQFLKDYNFIDKDRIPYQAYIAYFAVVPIPHTQKKTGKKRLDTKTYVTPKGFIFFRKFLSEHYENWRLARQGKPANLDLATDALAQRSESEPCLFH